MTHPIIAPAADDWDWMEFVVFAQAVESEGYEYAFDNYGPSFRRPELYALQDDMGGLRDFMDAHDSALAAWRQQVGDDTFDALFSAHLTTQRAESVKLRPGDAQ